MRELRSYLPDRSNDLRSDMGQCPHNEHEHDTGEAAMTIADFLAQAGFWQWVGIIIVAAVLSNGISRFRLWGNVIKTKNITKGSKDKQS